jgi:SET domain-containing protein
MIYVKTKLKESPIHGIGCFADEDISRGTLIWKFTKGYDQEFPTDYPEKLYATSREQFLKYAYVSRNSGNYILCTDDARFFNHSEDNNVINIRSISWPWSNEAEQEGIDIALRDIKAGEELTYDYNVFSPSPDGEL